MPDTTHLVAIHERLAREKAKAAQAKTASTKLYWQTRVDQTQRELDGELKFLGLDTADTPAASLSDDELLGQLLE